jgi:hypothetical protein
MENFHNNFLINQIEEKNFNFNAYLEKFFNIYFNHYIFFIDLIIIVIIIIFLYYFFNNNNNSNNYESLSLQDLEMIIKVKFEMFLQNNSLTETQVILLNKKFNELLYNLNLGLYAGSSLDFISNQIMEIFKNI